MNIVLVEQIKNGKKTVNDFLQLYSAEYVTDKMASPYMTPD